LTNLNPTLIQEANKARIMKEFSIPIDCVEKNGIFINKNYQEFLQNTGLDSFEALWRCREGQLIKDVRRRTVIRFVAADKGTEINFYLKLHKPGFKGLQALTRSFFGSKNLSQGLLEFNNICEFRKKGISTVIPVAAGEKSEGFLKIKSFLITRDCHPYISLETLMDKDPDFFKGQGGEKRKNMLLREVCRLAKKMHKAGFNHRDFNATHILLYFKDQSGFPDTALFDLQRVEKLKFLRLRWKIKSLARLNYTLPDDLFNSGDRKNILLFYKGKDRFNFIDRLEWLWIKKKTERIRRHTEKHYG
jgi:heptose I phosphotransferase